MKIALATDDFESVTGHVGRCNGFLVIDVEDENIVNVEKRKNNFTHHKMNRGQDHTHAHGHSHSSLVEGLSDCSHLICTAAGWRLQKDFENAGKEVIFTSEKNAETAAIKLSNGTLEINTEGACHSH
jgi:predicted Fe-Mo cluster-binding NifX family protein